MDIQTYHFLQKRFRGFFEGIGFLEAPYEPSILAACEDPRTVASFVIGGEKWPLPQTGQMRLEEELLADGENGRIPGVFCVTNSFRDEPAETFIEGRHERTFQMFEFESRGDVEDLKNLGGRFLRHMGFPEGVEVSYQQGCDLLGVDILEAHHENELAKEYGPVILLGSFPERTHPFWNMARYDGGAHSKKVDFLLHGMETIGSAEREVDRAVMRDRFYNISGGEYAGLLFREFGKERVVREMEEFLEYDMFPRFGGGMGVGRLARAMKMSGLLPDYCLKKEVAADDG